MRTPGRHGDLVDKRGPFLLIGNLGDANAIEDDAPQLVVALLKNRSLTKPSPAIVHHGLPYTPQ
jgi:hypothetical protein